MGGIPEAGLSNGLGAIVNGVQNWTEELCSVLIRPDPGEEG